MPALYDTTKQTTQEPVPDFSLPFDQVSQLDALADEVDRRQYRSDSSVAEIESAALAYAEALVANPPDVPKRLSRRKALETYETLLSLNIQQMPTRSARLRAEHWARVQLAHRAYLEADMHEPQRPLQEHISIGASPDGTER
jgi:hypothetical protein